MYESRAKTTEISATSKVAIKVKDNFYTIEYSEKRSIPDIEGVDLEAERRLLFDDCNSIVDDQCEEIIKTFSKK